MKYLWCQIEKGEDLLGTNRTTLSLPAIHEYQASELFKILRHNGGTADSCYIREYGESEYSVFFREISSGSSINAKTAVWPVRKAMDIKFAWIVSDGRGWNDARCTWNDASNIRKRYIRKRALVKLNRLAIYVRIGSICLADLERFFPRARARSAIQPSLPLPFPFPFLAR